MGEMDAPGSRQMAKRALQTALRQQKTGNRTSMDQPDLADFDAALAVAEYRRILDKRDAATDARQR